MLRLFLFCVAGLVIFGILWKIEFPSPSIDQQTSIKQTKETFLKLKAEVEKHRENFGHSA